MPNPRPSDAKLIEACLSGDNRAWDALISRYQRFIYSLAHRLGCSDADSDDVFQVASLRLYQHLEGVRNQESIAAWLATLVRNEVYRLHRRRSVVPMSDLGLEESEAAGSLVGSREAAVTPEQAALASERQQMLLDALGELKSPCRELLSRLYHEDSPGYAMVAAELGLPMGSIGPMRARCLKRLEKKLRDSGY